MSRYEIEPVPGLPEPLPDDETILWQGAPRWLSLARRTFHVGHIAAYFGILILWQISVSLNGGASLAGALHSSLWLVIMAVIAIGILAGMAWAMAFNTMYTITDKRIALRIGVAFPIVLNLPFKAIESADLKTEKDGTGNVAVQLIPSERIGYVLLWPHAKPWRMGRPEPMLRAIREPEKAAGILARALKAYNGQAVTVFAAHDEGTDARLGARGQAAVLG